MKPLFPFRLIAFLAFAAGFSCAVLHAQSGSTTAFYTVNFNFKLTLPVTASPTAGGGDVSIYDESTQGFVDSGIGGATSTSAPQTYISRGSTAAHIVPNKVYKCTISANCQANGATATVSLAPASVSGFKTYINGVAATSYTFVGSTTTPSTTFDLRIGLPDNYVLDPEPVSLAAGTATTMSSDKPVLYFGLGNMRNGLPAGVIGFRAQDFSKPSLFTPSALYVASYYPAPASELTQIPVTAGANPIVLRQVLSREVLVNITTISSTSYKLDFYPASAVTGQPGGAGTAYTFSGSPFVTYTIAQNTATGISITRVEDGITWETDQVLNGSTWTFNGWHKQGTSLSSTITTAYASGTAATVTANGPASGLQTTVASYPGDTAYSWNKTYTSYSWGLQLTNTTQGSGTSVPLVTNSSYYTSSAASGSSGAYQGLPQWTTNNDGTWSAYAYYVGDASTTTTIADGYVQTVYHPWLNTTAADNTGSVAAAATTSNSAYDVYQYKYVAKGAGSSQGATESIFLPSSIVSYAPGGTNLLKKTTWSYNTNAASLNGRAVWSQTENDFSSPSASISTTSLFYVPLASPDLLDNQPVSVTYPTGRKDSYVYFTGTWSASSNTFTASALGKDILAICFHGQTAGGTSLTTWSANGVSQSLDAVSMVANYSTATETVIDTTGHIVFTGQDVFTSSGTLARISGLASTYDGHGRLQKTTDIMRGSSAAPYQTVYNYTSGLLNSVVNPDGTSTTYQYDDLLRQTQKTTGITSLPNASIYPAKVQATTYDGANRAVATFTCSCGTAPTVFLYDTAGRVTQRWDPSPNGSSAPLVTSYTYSSLTSTTTTLPNGATTINTQYPDGRSQSVTGTAQPPQYYCYVINSTGLKTTRYNNTTADQTYGWTEDQYDLLARDVNRATPTYLWTSTTNASNIIDIASTYDSTSGLLTKTHTSYRSTGAQLIADHLYGYDGSGRLSQEGLDINNDGTLTAASGNDRYVTYALSYATDASGWTSIATTSSYPTATALQISKTVTRLTGFSSTAGTNGYQVADVAVTDVNGQVTEQIESVDASTLRHHVDVTRSGVSQTGWSETINGYDAETRALDGAQTKKEYDSLGRLVTIRSRWNGSAYLAADSVTFSAANYSKLPDSTVVDTVATSYTYTWTNSGSRTVTTTVKTQTPSGPVNTVGYTVYNAMDLPSHVGGAANSPVQYGYDSLGRMTSMTTWRTGPYTEANWPAVSTGDTTTWTIEPATGLGTSKIFADGKHADFSYTPLGLLYQRTWARTLPSAPTTPVTATYAYFDGSTTVSTDISNLTQELRSITYNDGTPGIAYTYNRSGLPNTIGDATTVSGTLGHTFAYDPVQPLRVSTETFSSYYGGRIETQKYDANYRPAGFTLSNSGNTANDLSQTWTFDPSSGLPKTLTTAPTGQSPASRIFTYSFLPNTELITGWSTGTGATAYQLLYGYEATTNRRNQIQSTMGGSSNIIAEFDPSYDTRGLIQDVTQKGSAFSDYYTANYSAVLNNYSYDSLGELKQAGLYRGNAQLSSYGFPSNATDELTGHKFIYAYDSMGNRLSSGESGNTVANGGSDDSYSVNNLNQYSQKDNYSVRVIGTAKAMAPGGHVAVATATSTNFVDHSWNADVIPNQGASAASDSVPVYASVPGGGTGGADVIGVDSSKSYLVAPTPQAFQYDADGNLVDDVLWHYTYDAENRLTSVYNNSAVIGASKVAPANARKLVFTYDYLGRRVEKQVYTWNGSAYAASATTDRKFIYNGWNLVAEYDVLAGSALKRSYTWGLDLTGSSGAAAGVGALVELTDHAAGKSYYPAYDQNGNVVALVNDGGSIAAAYEYSAFGELMRKDILDAVVTDNPFCYSTKYTDVETGLVYYGLRYYTPSLGRFINRDPIQETGGVNLYAFSANNPVSGFDVLGLDAQGATDPGTVTLPPFGTSCRRAVYHTQTASGCVITTVFTECDDGSEPRYDVTIDCPNPGGGPDQGGPLSGGQPPGQGNGPSSTSPSGSAPAGKPASKKSPCAKVGSLDRAGGIPNNVPGYNYLVSTSKPGDWFYPGKNPAESFLHFLGRSILNTTANPSFQNAMAFGGPGSNFGGALNQNLTLEETFSLTPKITKQMSSRGWDSSSINDTIQSPTATSPATNKATGGNATAFFNSDGSYVVRDNTTGTIIQISNRNDPTWIPDACIENPPPKH